MELERLELERLELEGERGGSEEDIFQVTGGGQKERYPGDYDRRCMNFATGLFLVVVCCCVVVCCLLLLFVVVCCCLLLCCCFCVLYLFVLCLGVASSRLLP